MEDLKIRLRERENEIDFLKVRIQDHKDSSAKENGDWKRQKKEMTKTLKDLEELCRDKTDFKQQIENEKAKVLNLQETVRTLTSELEDERQGSEERRQRVQRLGQKIKDLKVEQREFLKTHQRYGMASEEEGVGIYPFILLVVMISTFSSLHFVCREEEKTKMQDFPPREPSNGISVLGEGSRTSICDRRQPLAPQNETFEITVMAVLANESFLRAKEATFRTVQLPSTLFSAFKLPIINQSLNSNDIDKDTPYRLCIVAASDDYWKATKRNAWRAEAKRELNCEKTVAFT